MNTTKNSVLLIAPELRDFVSNIRQTVQLTVNLVLSEYNYIITINNNDIIFTSSVTATTEEILQGLMVNINSLYSEELLCTYADNILTITIINSNNSFNINNNKDVYINVTTIKNAHCGEELFNIVLNDVSIICHYNRFKHEQELAQRYLAAHILTLLNQKLKTPMSTVSNLIKDKVGDVEKWYSDNLDITSDDLFYMLSHYGKQYLAILARHKVYFI